MCILDFNKGGKTAGLQKVKKKKFVQSRDTVLYSTNEFLMTSLQQKIIGHFCVKAGRSQE